MKLVPNGVYHEVYLESIMNAEMLIEEAKLVAELKSKTHAWMMHNLAIEEVAKGYACLLAACGMIPRNHPLVRPRNKRSVFRDHDAKYSIFTAASQEIFSRELENAKRGEDSIFAGRETEILNLMAFLQESVSTAFRKAGVGDAELTGDGGIYARAIAVASTAAEGTKKRFEWMYVGLMKQKDGSWSVSSPLKSNPNGVGPDFRLTESLIAHMRSLDGARESPQFDAVRQEYRERLRRLDPSFPEPPIW